MAELADALDLGSSVLRRAGSTPVTRTKTNKALSDFRKELFFCFSNNNNRENFAKRKFYFILKLLEYLHSIVFIYKHDRI